MGWIILKYLTTAGLVVLISEVAKRHDKMGACVVVTFVFFLLTVKVAQLFNIQLM